MIFEILNFFRIDHANHDNDPVGASGDVIHYDETWKVARQFAIEHGNTAVVSVADHETGGLVLGGPIPTNVSYAWYPEYVAASTHSASFVVEEIKRGKDIKTAIFENYKLQPEDDEVKKIRELIDANKDSEAV